MNLEHKKPHVTTQHYELHICFIYLDLLKSDQSSEQK